MPRTKRQQIEPGDIETPSAPPSDVPEQLKDEGQEVSAPKPRRGRPPKLKAVPAMSAGAILAQSILDEAKRRLHPELTVPEPVPADELRETWEEEQETIKPEAPAALAGLYKVEHGNLFFSTSKVVRKGSNIRLNAEDAKMFLENELVRRLGD
jgi:hypothetical protein